MYAQSSVKNQYRVESVERRQGHSSFLGICVQIFSVAALVTTYIHSVRRLRASTYKSYFIIVTFNLRYMAHISQQ